METIKKNIIEGNVVFLDLVKKEILKGDDDLTEWIKSISDMSVISHKDNSILSEYAKILSFIQTSDLYTEKALTEWSKADVADPWLVAVGRTYNYTIITFETANMSLNSKNPTSKPKIPDLCSQFDVKCENLYYLMRQLSYTL